MKKSLKKILRRIIDSIALRIGYVRKNNTAEIDIRSKNHLLNTFYTILKSANFYPRHVVDIGANRGTWTRQALTHFPNSIYTLFEPQATLKKAFEDILQTNPNITFNCVGVGSEAGTFNFTIADRDDSCTFAFTPEQAKEKKLLQIKVPVVTLNEFIKTKNLPVPDIIKIDAEGLDIDVIKGASDFLGKTEVFLIEAGIVNKQIDNSFIKVINFMNDNGYILFDITDMNRPFNVPILWLTELVFVKKYGQIDSFKWTIND